MTQAKQSARLVESNQDNHPQETPNISVGISFIDRLNGVVGYPNAPGIVVVGGLLRAYLLVAHCSSVMKATLQGSSMPVQLKRADSTVHPSPHIDVHEQQSSSQ